MELLDYKQKTGLDELNEVNKAKFIAYYILKEENMATFSMTLLINKFEEFGYSKPNSSRLKSNIIKQKIMKSNKSEKGFLEFIPICYEEMNKEYGTYWNDFETITSDSELLDENKFCGKRTYLTKLIQQVNFTYGKNCYDACAVLLRRIFEIVLVLCFQNSGIENEISKQDGSHMMLEGITKKAINNKTLNISKRITDNFELFREVGNNSAHSITYTASKKDIDDIKIAYRVMLEDLYNKAGLL